MIIPHRNNQHFEYWSNLKTIKSASFTEFDEFRKYVLDILYNHTYTLYISKARMNDKNQIYNHDYFKSSDPEAIMKELEKYFYLAATDYPLIFGYGIRFELVNIYNIIVAEINYRNEVINNAYNLDHTKLNTDVCVADQPKLFQYLMSMITKEDPDEICSKSIFENYSAEQKEEFQMLKDKLKNQYIQNKIIEKEDNIINELYYYSNLKYYY